MKKIKKELSYYERKQWWLAAVGYIPTEEQLKQLVKDEPGLAKLIAKIFNLDVVKRDWYKKI